MYGSVRHMGRWYRLPDGIEIDARDITPGDCIKLRPLSRAEFVAMFADGAGELDVSALDRIPARFVADILRGVMDWTFLDESGDRLPCTDDEKAYLDPVAHDFAVGKIMELSTRSPGEAPGSGTNSSKAGRRRS